MVKRQLNALLYGWIFVLAFILITSFILALILQFTDISQWMLSWIAFGVGLIALFVGGMVTGVKGKAKGWIFGGITGLGFTIFVFLVQYLGYQNGFTFEQLLHHSGYILAAVFGGMIGVNMFSSTEK